MPSRRLHSRRRLLSTVQAFGTAQRSSTMPSADFCGAVSEDCSPLSPAQDTPEISRGQRSYLRCIDAGLTSTPRCGWRTLWWRAHSSRAYHTSYPVCVPRPAPSFQAAFRPHLAVTPWRFPGPSAPCKPGRGTFTPKHDTCTAHTPGVSRALLRVGSMLLFGKPRCARDLRAAPRVPFRVGHGVRALRLEPWPVPLQTSPDSLVSHVLAGTRPS